MAAGSRPVSLIPGPLVAILGVTLLSIMIPFQVPRVFIDGSLIDALQLPSLPEGNWGAFATGVITMALIASVESLLSAVSVDKMHTGPRTNFDRELIGQGSANIVSGAIGGLPITGVIVRSSANVASGAKSRASTVLHGVWVLLFALPFVALIQRIPSAALAGLLIVIGIQLVKRVHIKDARRSGELSVYVVTVAGVVFLNLLHGVLIGLALAIALTVWRVVRADIHAEAVGANQWRVVIEGSLSFLSLPRLTRVLQGLPAGTEVTVQMSVDFVDHAAHSTITDWEKQHTATGGTVRIDELGPAEIQSASSGPPVRAFSRSENHRAATPESAGNSPENSQRPATAGHRGTTGRSVMDGLAVYHRRMAPYLRPRRKDPEQPTSPDTLLLTCSDPRIDPTAVTDNELGELLTARSQGNTVSVDGPDTSVEDAIAFAVEELGVTTIVVCGHSCCAAMDTRLSGDDGLTAWHSMVNVADHPNRTDGPCRLSATLVHLPPGTEPMPGEIFRISTAGNSRLEIENAARQALRWWRAARQDRRPIPELARD